MVSGLLRRHPQLGWRTASSPQSKERKKGEKRRKKMEDENVLRCDDRSIVASVRLFPLFLSPFFPSLARELGETCCEAAGPEGIMLGLDY
jgi:hypothetical protein